MSLKITVKSGYTGSKETFEAVRLQILERYGQEAADEYDPNIHCMTYKKWLENGYKVRLGEKSLRSMTIVEKKGPDGSVIARYPKQVCLFHYCQVRELRK
ncbi:MAG: hypothetical protein WCO84_02535 [bacterium]